MIKVGNWWFLEEDPNRKSHADCEWGEPSFNTSMIEVIENYFQEKPRNHALDIGANIGFMTSYFAKRWKKTTAFEPTPSVFECLKKNCKGHDVHLKNTALSDRRGDLLFAINPKSEINQLISNESVLKKNWSCIKVPGEKLDDLEYNDVDVIKIDVEGHELSVVKGAEKTIKTNRPLIAVEISFENKILDKNISQNHTSTIKLLESWGYETIWNFKYDWILKPL